MDWNDREAVRRYRREYSRDRRKGIKRLASKQPELAKVPYGIAQEFRVFAAMRIPT